MNDPLHLLHTPLGMPGSGRVRYGAAMALFQRGRICESALEVYRICSPLDAQDPAALLVERGLRPLRVPGGQRLDALLVAVDRYLATRDGPGVVEARQGLARAIAVAPPAAAKVNPVVAKQMPVALSALRMTHADLAAAIAAATPDLHWITYVGYAEDEIGAGFARGHAYAPLVGEGAPYWAGDYDLGLFLIAPNILYRDHAHAAPELYLPMTGPHGWRFAPDAPLELKPAHEPVWNPPNQPHLTKVGPVPFLCLYVWTQDAQSPARVVPANDWAMLEVLRL